MPEPSSVPESNPLRQALPRARVPEPCAIVLFGSTGDLAHRKLVPALFHLARGGTCPAKYAIVGFARRDWTDDDLRADYEKTLSKNGGPDFREVWPQFASRLFFTPGTFDDPDGYQKLKEKLEEIDRTHGTRGNRVYYLAVSPEFFATIIGDLGEAGLIYPWQQESPWSRVVIEKPFGRDLASAAALESRCLARARREPGLSHRPLPGQGDGAEHPGVPVRQQHLRADLEPPACRTRCRSPSPRRSAWPAAGAPITTPPARSATWSRTT